MYNRYTFFLKLYKKSLGNEPRDGDKELIKYFKQLGFNNQTDWLALATIDTFFSWTEHVFIHLAILKGNLTTGTQVADMAEKEWA